MPIDGTKIRSTLLEVLEKRQRSEGNSPSIQQSAILQEAVARLGSPTNEEGQAILTAWYDLFRSGHLSWGFNLENADPPFCHLTEQGRRALQHLSRDPANPDGYWEHVNSRGSLNPIAIAYVREALLTYNTNCFRACAVMIGAAAESLSLDLRDAVIAGLKRTGRTASKDLNDFRIKRVLDALQRELESQKAGMGRQLFERFQAYWPAFTQQIRAARNDAGHPSDIDSCTPETVHAALLVFPELASLNTALLLWVQTNYK